LLKTTFFGLQNDSVGLTSISRLKTIEFGEITTFNIQPKIRVGRGLLSGAPVKTKW